jgi:hypothetical protein
VGGNVNQRWFADHTHQYAQVVEYYEKISDTCLQLYVDAARDGGRMRAGGGVLSRDGGNEPASGGRGGRRGHGSGDLEEEEEEEEEEDDPAPTLTFKPSTRKADSLLTHIPTNLHIQVSR